MNTIAARLLRCAARISVVILLAASPPVDADPGQPDQADVAINPPGFDYDIRYDNDPLDIDFLSDMQAAWISNAVITSHWLLVGFPHGFRAPRFTALPNLIRISEGPANATANAPQDRINVNAIELRGASEPFTRAVMIHEMFHHVQYAYIRFSEWQSWGRWTVEATASAMEDRLATDLDGSYFDTFYRANVDSYLANPNADLTTRSYDAALFWNYMAEQLGSFTGEPERGVDLIRGFWERTTGNSPDSIRYLRDTISAYPRSRTLEDVFIDFAIANYTHDLDVSLLPADRAPRYRYVDESPGAGGTLYRRVARNTIPAINMNLSGNVVRWGAQYFERAVNDLGCQVAGFRATARDNKSLGWALVGVRSGNRVSEISRGIGSTFYKALINNPADNFERLALVVVGLNNSATFDYALGTGQVGGEVTLPTTASPALVGRIGEPPERFQIRLRLQGPAILTPEGYGPVSVRGLDASRFRILLRSRTTGAVYPVSAVVNADYVDGEYWLVVQAPEITNPADGQTYDLEVCLCQAGPDGCEFSLQSPLSVIYDDVRVLQMIVLDRSGSMAYPSPVESSKLTAAKNAARLAVDVLADDDSVGYVTFHGDGIECNIVPDVDLVRSLQPVSSALRTDLKNNAIDNTVLGDWTSIGNGLKVGRDQLIGAATIPGDVKNILLLSDGRENEADYWARDSASCGTTAVSTSFARSTGSAADQRIDTIAFGTDADANLLESIAHFTAGRAYAPSAEGPVGGALASLVSATASPSWPIPTMASLESPNRLAHVYRSIEEDLHHEARFFYRAFRLISGFEHSFLVPVTEGDGGGIQQPTFVFNWHRDLANVEIVLNDPLGNGITAASPGWTIFENKTHKIYRYDGFLPTGDYAAFATADEDVQLLVMLSGRLVRGVTLEVHTSQVPGIAPGPECDAVVGRPFANLRGLPVSISANAHDAGGAVRGLELEALVENADGSINRISLYDDGLHDNGVEGDGIYGNRYTRTPFFSTGGESDVRDHSTNRPSGSYVVQTYAKGVSNAGEPFERAASAFFSVYEYDDKQGFCDPDSDNDELPDRWEDLYGLDRTDPLDALLDIDADGLSNVEEFAQGTLPRSADTDGGGESDGSEVASDRDPLYDRDDLLPAVIDYGVIGTPGDIPTPLPEPNTVMLRFPVNTAYQFMQIWRTDPNGADFHLIDRVDLAVADTGTYYDRGLVNGAVYQYFLVAEGLSGAHTAPTESFAAVPKADPVAPRGVVRINNDAAFTASLNVTLSLSASPDTTQMVVSEDPGFQGAVAVPFASSIPFTLSGANNPATVYVRFLDASQNESDPSHDSIRVELGGDADGDGLADSWEFDHFGGLAANAGGDDDSDGASNFDEFRNGTDPVDPESPAQVFLGIVCVGPNVVLNWSPSDAVLEHATSANGGAGGWVSIPGATSPFTLPASLPEEYFRLRRENETLGQVGYATLIVPPGFSLIANPFQAPDNTLGKLLPSAPDGTQVYKFGDAGFVTFTFDGLENSWLPNGDVSLLPGEGAFVRNGTGSDLTICFTGAVKTGQLVTFLPAGFSIRSSPVPIPGTPDQLGIPSRDGDQLYLFRDGQYSTYTFDGLDSAWIPVPPVIAPGTSFFVRKNAPDEWFQNSNP